MTTRRRWTDETIHTELAPIVAELGRMPTRTDLSERGLGAAWSAMQRRGGVRAWRHRLTSPLEEARPAPSRREIERRAYFIAQKRGGDPVANWLAAESELLAA